MSARERGSVSERLLAYSGLATLVLVWWLAVRLSATRIVPSPWQVARGLASLAASGALFKHAVASLFRVSWGFVSAAALGIPTGLALGWSRRVELAFNPFLQLLRPISPLAWIPIAILWFGVGDRPAVFIIFLASFLPIVVGTMNAVGGVAPTHVNVARNLGMSPVGIIVRVVLPSIAARLVVTLRLTLGIAWLVVVAAEMIAVNSGLGFLIIDSRNAGDRYDLVVAGMTLVGVIGLGLDTMVRRLENLRVVSWAFAGQNASRDHGASS